MERERDEVLGRFRHEVVDFGVSLSFLLLPKFGSFQLRGHPQSFSMGLLSS
jgi:hypothetical protein